MSQNTELSLVHKNTEKKICDKVSEDSEDRKEIEREIERETLLNIKISRHEDLLVSMGLWNTMQNFRYGERLTVRALDSEDEIVCIYACIRSLIPYKDVLNDLIKSYNREFDFGIVEEIRKQYPPPKFGILSTEHLNRLRNTAELIINTKSPSLREFIMEMIEDPHKAAENSYYLKTEYGMILYDRIMIYLQEHPLKHYIKAIMDYLKNRMVNIIVDIKDWIKMSQLDYVVFTDLMVDKS